MSYIFLLGSIGHWGGGGFILKPVVLWPMKIWAVTWWNHIYEKVYLNGRVLQMAFYGNRALGYFLCSWAKAFSAYYQEEQKGYADMNC